MSYSLDERYEMFGGRVSYRELAHGAGRWLTLMLTCTDAARGKLDDWLRSCPGPPWVAPSIEELEMRAHYHGDFALVRSLANALQKVPPPVRDYALQKVTFMGIGLHALGFCGARPELPDARPWWIVSSAKEACDTFGHEIAHCWLNQEPDATYRTMTAFHQNDLLQTPDRIYRQLSRDML